MLMHRRYQDHSNCPLCGKHGEKVSHVLRCQDPDGIERVIERVEGPFTKILVKHSTQPHASRQLSWQFCRPCDTENQSQRLTFLLNLDYTRRLKNRRKWDGTTCLDDGSQNGKQYKLITLPLFQARRLPEDGPPLSYTSSLWMHGICGSIEMIDYTDLLDPLCWTSTDNSIYGLRKKW